MKTVSYKIELDNPNHIFVIAEAGSNWKIGSFNKNLRQAKKLIDIAKECGVDAVKFQTFRTGSVYVPHAGNSNYLTSYGIRKSINKIFENAEMPYDMLEELAEYCKKKNIEFMSTAFSVADAREVNKYVKIHKVASYEINHIRLLEYLAKTKKPVILSTGASNYEEIDFAVNFLKRHGVKEYALLQCTAKYPTPLESLNLLAIPEMKKRYNIPVGLSDHSLDPIIGPLTAIGLGARIIEKHFTLNRNLSGPDHKFALIPIELKKMVQSIRMAEKTLGDGKKRVLSVEKNLRNFAMRRIQTTSDIKRGERFVEGKNIAILRPGKRKKGADARFLSIINGKKSKKSIKIGDGVRLQDSI